MHLIELLIIELNYAHWSKLNLYSGLLPTVICHLQINMHKVLYQTASGCSSASDSDIGATTGLSSSIYPNPTNLWVQHTLNALNQLSNTDYSMCGISAISLGRMSLVVRMPMRMWWNNEVCSMTVSLTRTRTWFRRTSEESVHKHNCVVVLRTSESS